MTWKTIVADELHTGQVIDHDGQPWYVSDVVPADDPGQIILYLGASPILPITVDRGRHVQRWVRTRP